MTAHDIGGILRHLGWKLSANTVASLVNDAEIPESLEVGSKPRHSLTSLSLVQRPEPRCRQRRLAPPSG